jgi:apolipoprotein N-acyltransferase
MTARTRPELPAAAQALLFLASAGLWYFAIGDNYDWWAPWLAPLPLLVLAFGSSVVVTGLAAFAAVAAGLLNVFIHHGFALESQNILVYLGYGVDETTYVGPVLAYSAAAAVIVLLARFVTLRLRHPVALFAFPALWTGYEYLVYLARGGNAGFSLAYTQLDILPLVQIAASTGPWGVVFLVMTVPAGLATAWLLARQPRRAIVCLAVPAALVLLAFVYGSLRIGGPAAGPPAVVAVVAPPTGEGVLEATSAEAVQAAIKAYEAPIDALAGSGVELVVLPEKLASIGPDLVDGTFAHFQSIADRNGLSVLAGFTETDAGGGAKNTARLFAPGAVSPVVYVKEYLIPGLESRYTAGSAPLLLKDRTAPWGVTICRDMDFPAKWRGYSRQRTGLMAVPALDFDVDAWHHARVAIFAGIAGGFAVARNGQWGMLSISDDRGRVLAAELTSHDRTTAIQASVPVGRGDTLYARFGDWFALLSLAGAVLLIGAALVARRDDKKTSRGNP